MPLKFHPSQGAVLICDYSTGFILPEMIKKRPVVVVTPRPRRQRQLCTVVPLSTTKPEPVEKHHCKLDALSLPDKFSIPEVWVKCDMIATVSLERLDRIKIKKNADGKRLYANHYVINEDLQSIIKCILQGLGLEGLIKHL